MVLRPKNPSLILSFFLILIHFSFSFFVFSSLPIFELSFTTKNSPSERANITSVSFTCTISTSWAPVRGLVEGSFAVFHPWTGVHVFWLLKFIVSLFLLFINFGTEHFPGQQNVNLSALHWFSSYGCLTSHNFPFTNQTISPIIHMCESTKGQSKSTAHFKLMIYK